MINGVIPRRDSQGCEDAALHYVTTSRACYSIADKKSLGGGNGRVYEVVKVTDN